MSTAAVDAGIAPPAKGKKKLILIAAAALVLLAAIVAALVLLKSRTDVEEGDPAEPPPSAQHEPMTAAQAPTYVPLEAFTINLADREADRYAQIAVVLELDDAAHAEAIKAFMPAVRNNILMLLAHKTAGELMEREGKRRLAQEIRVETGRALGMPATNESVDPASDGGRRAPARKPEPTLPVRAVHFATFIIQ